MSGQLVSVAFSAASVIFSAAVVILAAVAVALLIADLKRRR